MRLLITGGLGYIGSHCVIAALDRGYDVLVFDNLVTGHIETNTTLSKIKAPGRYLGLFRGDLNNREDTLGALEGNIDAVVHFAALSLVGDSMKDPKSYYKNNICGTMNLLDAMLENGVNKIVFSSSAAVYGEPRYVPVDENHTKIPINPYGNTKLAIERIMDDYDFAYGLRSIRLRYFNVAGADEQCRVGEWHVPETHLIPNILKSTFGAGKKFDMFGDDYPTCDGTCVRDYVNVEDLVEAHMRAIDLLLKGGKTDYFNLGTNSGNTVKEILSECEMITGKKIPVNTEGRRSGDPAVLFADNTKAREILGWEPKRSLSDTIKTAYAWEKKLHSINEQ